MGRNFPSRRIRHRFDVWRDRRRYPWRYPETETRRFGRRAPHTMRRRYFVMRSVDRADRIDHYVFAECPTYRAAMEVAALHGDRVLTEGQMLDHPERRRVMTAWDKGEGPQPGREPSTAARSRQTSIHKLSTFETSNG